MGAVLGKFWGFLALFIALVAWAALIAGEVAAASIGLFILIASALAALYFLFQFPAWCRAEGRLGPCRNNSHGLLIGCYLRQHKWQRLKMLFRVSSWRVLSGRMWARAEGKAATLGALGSAVSGLAAIIAIMVH
jgi:hypothetical protein